MKKKDKAKMLNDIVSGKDSEAYNTLLKEAEDAKILIKIQAYPPEMLTFFCFFWRKESKNEAIPKDWQEVYNYIQELEKPCKDVEDYRNVCVQVMEKYKDFFKIYK